jgi:hypothetical protein
MLRIENLQETELIWVINKMNRWWEVNN